MNRLRHKLAELLAIIDFHKEDYAQTLFEESYEDLESQLGNLYYPEVIPRDSQILMSDASTVSRNRSMLEAYSIFQRLALALEIVIVDLNHNIDHSDRRATKRMWRRSSLTVTNILKNIYADLVMKGLDIPEPIHRETIPNNLRCLQFTAFRDTRDFIILRHLKDAANYYSELLV